MRAGPKAAVDGAPLHTRRRIALAVAAVAAHSLATWLAGCRAATVHVRSRD